METNLQDFPAEKIRNPELARIALGNSDARASVLIEPDLPSQQVEIDQSRTGTPGHFARRFVQETDEQKADIEKNVEAVKSSLQALLGQSPTWLNAARVFVATVAPSELRQIARLPLVRAIHLNRNWRPSE